MCRAPRRTLSLAARLFAVPVAVLLSGAASYQVNHGTSQTITEHGVCRTVSNNHASGHALFVPTNTPAEWAAFRTNVPPGVTAAPCNIACTLPWGGTIADGASVTAYATTSGCAAGGCASETRTCSGGELSGSYQQQACGTALCTQTFASSGTWTRPDSGINVSVQCWGGGGGGARGTSTRKPGGGGGGGYSAATFARTSLEATVTVTIGAGGAGATGNPGNGGTGGNTTFGSHLTAGGGARGGNGSPGGGGVGTTENGGTGGVDGGTVIIPGNTTYAGGGGGGARAGLFQPGGTSTYGGNGGTACENCTTNNGAVPGGGGGAERAGSPAGVGGAGRCEVVTGP